MYTKTITFKDLEDNDITRKFYFNISKPEIMNMQLKEKNGFDRKLKRIAEDMDGKGLMEAIDDFIMMSYGEKGDDGISFIKKRNGVSLAENFKNTDAYNVLFEGFLTDPKSFIEFITGIMPKDLSEQMMSNINARGGIDAVMADATQQVGGTPAIEAK